jgi:uncharacterized protein YktB (UPF0637 family)
MRDLESRFADRVGESKATATEWSGSASSVGGYGPITRGDVGAWEDAYTLWYYVIHLEREPDRVASQLGCSIELLQRWLSHHHLL